MVLQKINVTDRGDNKYSINLKELELGNHIILEKINELPIKDYEKDFGNGIKKSYLWVQKLEDIEVSFFLTEKQNQNLIENGKLGDKLIVTREEGRYDNPKTGVTLLYKTITFKVKEDGTV